MASKFGTWWQKIEQHRLMTAFIVVAGVLVTVLIVVVILGYLLNWSGVGVNGGYSKVTTTSTTKGITTAIEQPLTKTLWDWMQLLIVPIVLAIGGYWFNQIQKSRDERATKQRDTTEREIAADNQREAALQAYLDKMSELLLEGKLRHSAQEDEKRKIARVRTLTVLNRLDPIRKASVIQFLYESGLIDKEKCIISLEGANLRETILGDAYLSLTEMHRAFQILANSLENFRGAFIDKANLSEIQAKFREIYATSGVETIHNTFFRANFSRANFSGANFSKAHLTGTNFSETNFSGAILSEANFSEANLSGANFSGAILSEANLSFATLSGADLEGAIGVTREELEKQATSLQGATMPDGSKYS